MGFSDGQQKPSPVKPSVVSCFLTGYLSPEEKLKVQKKNELRQIVSRFASEAQQGIPCKLFHAVTGGVPFKSNIDLVIDPDLQLVTINPKGKRGSALMELPVAEAKVYDYETISGLRPDSAGLKDVRSEDQDLCIVVYRGNKPPLIIIVKDKESQKMIVTGLQVLAPRAKQVAKQSSLDHEVEAWEYCKCPECERQRSLSQHHPLSADEEAKLKGSDKVKAGYVGKKQKEEQERREREADMVIPDDPDH